MRVLARAKGWLSQRGRERHAALLAMLPIIVAYIAVLCRLFRQAPIIRLRRVVSIEPGCGGASQRAIRRRWPGGARRPRAAIPLA